MTVAHRPLSPAEIARILRETNGAPPVPPRTDRAAWQALGQLHIADEVMIKAEAAMGEPIPPLPLSLYLDYHRTGRREGYELPLDARRDRLTWMTLAECIEPRGRFIDAIHDMLDAIRSEPTWVVPAHGAEFTDGLPMPDQQVIDLWSAMACLLVAEVDHMLSDALHPALRQRVRMEVDERGTAPLLARDDMRWMGGRETGRTSPNWAPVCAGLTAGAALYLERDTDRLAVVIAKALRELDHYLGSFPEDGGCSEGIGYWEKGVFAYTCFADLLAARTQGRIDPMRAPHLREVARFPARVQMGPQLYPLFSDNVSNRIIQPALLRHLAHRLDLPELIALDPRAETERTHTDRYPAEQIRDFLWWKDAVGAARPALFDWLPDTQIFVARFNPADISGLVVAAKAGTNGEPHNHNDVGSFIISLASETPITEIGAGLYARQTFDPAHRYSLPNYGSHGHSVPEVNGFHQSFGAEHAACDVFCNGDRLSMDLAPCYPVEAGVNRLVRTIALDRTDGAIHLEDVAEFDAPGTFRSVLITQKAPRQTAPGIYRIGPLDVIHDPDLRSEAETLPPITTRDGRIETFHRFVLSHASPAQTVAIKLTLRPHPPSPGDRT